MGIDIQSLKLLRISYDKFGPFKKTLTIGRQGNHSPKWAIQALLKDAQSYKPNEEANYMNTSEFSENLFTEYLGADSVDSMDVSSYERATILHDMNLPVENYVEEFDTIFDGGSLEHIYNIPQAFQNLSKMCKVGGQILHVLPANNQCGHGFWQMSPELFFSLYSEKNGYKETEVYLGDTTNPNWTYKISPPEQGQRHDIQHPNPIYCMVRTVRASETFTHKNIQQSDYMVEWSKSE